MNSLSKIGLAGLAAVGGIYWLGTAQPANPFRDPPGTEAAATVPWDGAGAKYACEQAIEKAAVDPRSIEWIDRLSWPTVETEVPETYIVRATWRGKNGFGGMVQTTTICMVTHLGEMLIVTKIGVGS